MCSLYTHFSPLCQQKQWDKIQNNQTQTALSVLTSYRKDVHRMTEHCTKPQWHESVFKLVTLCNMEMWDGSRKRTAHHHCWFSVANVTWLAVLADSVWSASQWYPSYCMWKNGWSKVRQCINRTLSPWKLGFKLCVTSYNIKYLLNNKKQLVKVKK